MEAKTRLSFLSSTSEVGKAIHSMLNKSSIMKRLVIVYSTSHSGKVCIHKGGPS